MKLRTHDWKSDTPDFVTHDVLATYIQDTATANDILPHISFRTRVNKVEKRGTKWEVSTSKLVEETGEKEIRNTVQVCVLSGKRTGRSADERNRSLMQSSLQVDITMPQTYLIIPISRTGKLLSRTVSCIRSFTARLRPSLGRTSWSLELVCRVRISVASWAMLRTKSGNRVEEASMIFYLLCCPTTAHASGLLLVSLLSLRQRSLATTIHFLAV